MRTLTLAAMTLFLALTSPLATAQVTFSNIQNMVKWDSCDICSGAGGAGGTTVYWQARFQTSPSLSGSSSQFYYGGGTAYTSALFWEQLGSYPSYSHFNYELDFYLKDATVPQALEFDVNQGLNGQKYVFGTECNLRGTYAGYWRVWDANLHWQNTGVACVGITSKTWHHLKWEFARTTGGHTHFIAVTVDGVRRLVDKYYSPLASSAKELNVAVQTDGNKYGNSFSVWLDNVKLYAY